MNQGTIDIEDLREAAKMESGIPLTKTEIEEFKQRLEKASLRFEDRSRRLEPNGGFLSREYNI